MKRALSLAAIILVIAAIIGCEKPQPEAPTLIEPEDGAVFDTLPPTFMWSSEKFAEGYLLEANKDTFGLGVQIDGFDGIYRYVDDTSYTATQNEFDSLADTLYYWHVASFWIDEAETLYTWSDWRNFKVDRPVEPTLDLDTTYFPLGLWYEWGVEQHRWYNSWDTSWDKYTTYINIITDSFYLGDTFFFEYNSSGSYVRIWDNKIDVKGERINLVPDPDTFKIQDNVTYTIGYRGDTLIVEVYADYSDDYHVDWEHRLRGIGAIYTGSAFYGNWGSSGYSHRTLYFYNGTDTIYKLD